METGLDFFPSVNIMESLLRPTRPLLTSEPQPGARIRSFPPMPRPPHSPLPNRRRFLPSPRPLPASTHGLLLLIVSNKLLRSRTLECSPAAAMSRTWSITFILPRKAADSGGGSAKSPDKMFLFRIYKESGQLKTTLKNG